MLQLLKCCPFLRGSLCFIGAIGIGAAMHHWQFSAEPVSPSQRTAVAVPTIENSSSDDEKITFPPAQDLVKEWDPPAVTLFVSGGLKGYIEPCGCTGLENQKGGLLRRRSAQKVLLDRGWNLITIDSGDIERRTGSQARVKIQTTYEILCRIMNYDVIAWGPEDLKTPAIDLVQALIDNAPSDQMPIVAGNVEVLSDEFSAKFRVVERNGLKVGITTAIADSLLQEIKDDEIKVMPLANQLNQITASLRQAKCNYTVLLLHGSLEECRDVAQRFPFFDVMIAAGGAGDPTFQPEVIPSGRHVTQLIQVGAKGMHVGLVGLYAGQKKLVYERVPMDARFADDDEVKVSFKRYQDRLKMMYEDPKTYQHKDIEPRKHPSGNLFVGSSACKDCHEEEYDVWRKGLDEHGGPHFRATLDLTEPGERTWVQRHYDPECISCHVTGWNPQGYYPYETGYLTESDKKLHGNGCENCHGPGSKHVAVENGELEVNETEAEQILKGMRMTLEEARGQACMECHDIDNSPDFFKDGAFDKYWAKIKHGSSASAK